MNEIKRVQVLGVPVDNVDMDAAIARIDGWLQNHAKGNTIYAINPEKVMLLRRKQGLKAIVTKGALLIPDGIGVVKAMRWIHGLESKRVAGVALMHQICALAARKAYRIYLYGSQEYVNKKAAEELKRLYPDITIVGRRHGYITADKKAGLIEDINRKGTDILLVALGSPMQEYWIDHHLHRLDISICQAVGGSLDAIAGKVKRAPVFFQNMGLEWLYRLITQPKRIQRQRVLPFFAGLALLEVIIKKRRHNNA